MGNVLIKKNKSLKRSYRLNCTISGNMIIRDSARWGMSRVFNIEVYKDGTWAVKDFSVAKTSRDTSGAANEAYQGELSSFVINSTEIIK